MNKNIETDVLALLAKGNGDDIILSDLEHQYSLDEIYAQCNELEHILSQQDIKLLAMYVENGPPWVVADMLCQRLNICLVPLPSFFSPLQLNAVLAECGAAHLLTDNPEALRALCESPFGMPGAKTGLQLFRLDNGENRAPRLPRETGKITFTSGSTGEAKGVCLSNRQLLKQAAALADSVGIKSPRHLCLLPLSTLLENVAGIYAPLLAGGQVILPSLAEMGYVGSRLVAPEKFLEVISRTQPDTVILIPELLKLLVAAAKSGWPVPDSFKFIAVGGSRVGSTLLAEAWSMGLPVYEGYGLSECASVVSLNTQNANLEGSCGKVLSHLEVSVVDGEIVVEGNAMLGYLNQSENWYPEAIATGDLGYQDEKGFLHLQGRKKNMLISSYGRNISPEWVESELQANPLLQDAVVFGDARPSCVALVSSRELQLEDEVINQWIIHVNEKLPDYARISAWHRLRQPLGLLPGLLTGNGRPRREQIANHYKKEIQALYSGLLPQTEIAEVKEMLS